MTDHEHRWIAVETDTHAGMRCLDCDHGWLDRTVIPAPRPEPAPEPVEDR